MSQDTAVLNRPNSTSQRKSLLQAVAIHLMWPNPDNPRSAYSPEDIQTLAANLQATGQRTPVKLVPLTEEEKATLRAGSYLEPAQPNHGSRLEASAQAGLYEYKLLGGHMRREAALSLGWGTLEALILDLSPEEAELEMILDNRIIELPWLDQYKIIERYKAKNPKMSQEEIGTHLGVDQVTISRALKTMKALNQASRDLVYSVCIKPGGKADGGKMVALALASLEDPEKVEQALKVALDRKLTEAQAKKLVEHVQASNPAVSFNHQKAPTPKVKAPKTLTSATEANPAVTNSTEPTQPADHSPKTPTPSTGSMSEGEQVTGSSHRSGEPVQAKHAPRLEGSEQLLWEAAAGVSVISRIKAKVKKGERPSFFEALLLAAHALWTGLAGQAHLEAGQAPGQVRLEADQKQREGGPQGLGPDDL